jgi:hypothetical protein
MRCLQRFRLAVMVCLLAGSWPLVVFAHHTYVTKYDNKKIINVSGTVSDVSFGNPHIFFTLTTGKGDWRVETESLSVAQARGLTQSLLKEGAKATVSGWPSRDGTGELGLKSISFQGGPSVTMRNTAR